MENKIRVNVNDKDILRLSIPTENGKIIINNPSKKIKNDIINELVTLLSENKEINEKEIVLKLINHCTNVEFDGDIFETENLSHEAQMIINEITSIFQEIISEAYQVIKLAMQQIKNDVLQKEVLNEKDNILEIAEKRKEEKELIEIQKRVVKKPNRSKGRVYRK